MSDIRMTSGVLLDMRGRQAIGAPELESADGSAGKGLSLSFEAGASVSALNRALGADRADRVSFALLNQPGYGELTYVGCMSVGGHGSGVGAGALASQVRALSMVGIGSDGAMRAMELDQGHAHWRAATVGLGLVGVIERLTIGVQRGFRIRELRAATSLSELKKRLDELVSWNESTAPDGRLGVPHSFEIWFNPYTGRAALGQRWMTMDPVVGRRPFAQRTSGFGALEVAFDLFDSYGSAGRFGRSDLVAEVLDAAIDGVIHEEGRHLVLTAADGLDFAAPNQYDTVASAVGVPAERCMDALAAITRLCDELREVSPSAGGPLYVSSPIGVRFVRGEGDKRPYLAPQFEGLTAMIELPCLATVRSSERVLSKIVRMLMSDFGGRPHWGQFLPSWIRGADIRRVYGDDAVEGFLAARRELDPKGRLDNAFAVRMGLVA